MDWGPLLERPGEDNFIDQFHLIIMLIRFKSHRYQRKQKLFASRSMQIRASSRRLEPRKGILSWQGSLISRWELETARALEVLGSLGGFRWYAKLTIKDIRITTDLTEFHRLVTPWNTRKNPIGLTSNGLSGTSPFINYSKQSKRSQKPGTG